MELAPDSKDEQRGLVDVAMETTVHVFVGRELLERLYEIIGPIAS